MRLATEQDYLDNTQFQVLEAVKELESLYGKANSSDIAANVALSYSQTLRYLKRLVALGYIQRVGQRAGWKLRDNNDLAGRSESYETTSRSAGAERPDPLKLLPQYQMEKLPPVGEECSCTSYLKPVAERRQA